MLKAFLQSLFLTFLGVVFIGLLIAYVKFSALPADPNAPLQASVDRQIVFPWQDQTVNLMLDYKANEAEPTTITSSNYLFLVDVSSSMSGSLDKVEGTVKEFMKNISSQSQKTEVSIVSFDEKTQQIQPFTADIANLKFSLQGIGGGGTSIVTALNDSLSQYLANKPGATVILVTDGAAESYADLQAFYQQKWKNSGHELFLVIIPSGGNNDLVDAKDVCSNSSIPHEFCALTDEPERYILSGSATTLPNLFNQLAQNVGNIQGTDALLWLPLIEPLWHKEQQASSSSDTLNCTDSFPINCAMPRLFHRPYHWQMPLIPQIGGVLTLTQRPINLRYVRCEPVNNDPSATCKTVTKKLNASGTPKVLVITPWLVFMLALLALLPLIYQILAMLFTRRSHQVVTAPIEQEPIVPPTAVSPIHFLPIAKNELAAWIPSLVIGLGNTGFETLTHLKQAVYDTLDDGKHRPTLLSLKMYGQQPASVQGVIVELDDYERLHLEPNLLITDIQQSYDDNDPRAELDLSPYISYSTITANNIETEAPLARLALLKELSTEHSIWLETLKTQVETWQKSTAGEKQRQIIIIASIDEGIGCGWLTDLGVLLQRLLKDKLGIATHVLLAGERTQYEPNLPFAAATIFDELERFKEAGHHPFEHLLAAKEDDLLKGLINTSIFSNVYCVTANEKTDLPPMTADALSLLMVKTEQNLLSPIKGYSQLSVHQAASPRYFWHYLLASALKNYVIEKLLFSNLKIENGNLVLNTLANSELPTTRNALINALNQGFAAHNLTVSHLIANWDNLKNCLSEQELHSLRTSVSTWGKSLIGIDPFTGTKTNPQNSFQQTSINCENAHSQLTAWEQSNSRQLKGYLEVFADDADWQNQLTRLFEEFSKQWQQLFKETLQESLSKRLYWRLSGDPLELGIFFCAESEAEYSADKFIDLEAVLAQLVAKAVDRLDYYAIFNALYANKPAKTNDKEYAESLIGDIKANLEGVHAPLIYSSSYPATHSDFHQHIVNACNAMRHAGELHEIEVRKSYERYRIFLTQTVSELKLVEPTDPPAMPLHRYEKLRRDAAKELKRVKNYIHVQLPIASGIALQDEPRLAYFAYLYKKGDVTFYSGQWTLNNAPLSRFNNETLTDVAVTFVTDSQWHNKYPTVDYPQLASPNDLYTEGSKDYFLLLLDFLYGKYAR